MSGAKRAVQHAIEGAGAFQAAGWEVGFARLRTADGRRLARVAQQNIFAKFAPQWPGQGCATLFLLFMQNQIIKSGVS